MSVKNKRVFVTGATGNIGVNLVVRLLRDGYNVYILTRNASKITFDRRVKVIQADIFDVDKYKEVMCSCDYVFHLAVYQNTFDKQIDNFEKVNVLGLQKIINVLDKSKIIKFFYVSTTMVFDKFTEGNFYVKTKIKALKIVKLSKLPWVILYPSIVVNLTTNRGSKLWNLLTGGIPGGLMMRLCPRDKVFNFIFIDDLVNQMVELIHNPKIRTDYMIKGDDITADNYLRKVYKLKGRRYLPWRIPIFQ